MVTSQSASSIVEPFFRGYTGRHEIAPAIASNWCIKSGRYLIRFAASREELQAALKLRFQVFNLELGEGLESSFATGQDEDEFDQQCQHLVIVDSHTAQVVGTYRMQMLDTAVTAKGFYSDREFDLSLLPLGVLENALELGRACISKDHRNTQVLLLLWKGIASYVAFHHKRYLFGCCSLTSQDQAVGTRTFEYLKQNGYIHQTFCVAPRSGFDCQPEKATGDCPLAVSLPQLFKIYLRLGAKVCSPPAIDRNFKTIDFLVLFDVDAMEEKAHSLIFGA